MRTIINVNILEARGDRLYLAGTIPNYDPEMEDLYIADEKIREMHFTPYRAEALDFHPTDNRNGRTGYVYEIHLPLRAGATYHFFCRNTDGPRRGIHTLSPRYRRFSRLSDVKRSFFSHGDLLIRTRDDGISILRNDLFTRRTLERKLRKHVREQAPPHTLDLRRKAMRMRKRHKPIWLISDRTDAAGDNGEFFFEYLMRSGAAKRYAIYFLIDRNSPDYERIRSIGPVIPVGTEEHKVAFLASSMLLSSSITSWMLDPLGSERIWYQDIVDHDFVFLQHGVVKDDQSGWLYRLRQNIGLFVTSTQAEWESIAHGAPAGETDEDTSRPGPYGYDESVVKLTGLPRYDRFRAEPEDGSGTGPGGRPEKKIAILPNWRPSFAPGVIPGTSDRPYSETFRDSDFCRFYNRLINDPQLLQAMQENGYTGTFYLPANHRNQWPDFKGNDLFTVWKDPVPYVQAVHESALLITDYTSEDFDYAYLGKPVIYTQMDREDFLSRQRTSQGWFDYERDGFGPVCESFEETVAAIVEMLKEGCRQADLYRERADRVFPFRDRNNCKRIYGELLKLTK